MTAATQSVPSTHPPSHNPHFQLVQPPMQVNAQSHRRKKSLFHVGCIEFPIGGLSIILAIISVKIVRPQVDSYNINGYNALSFTYSSQGIWGGFFILVTGVLGILSLNNCYKCYYISNVIMAIVTAVIGCIAAYLSAWAALFCVFSTILSVLHLTIGSLSALGVFLAAVHAAFSCGRICCSSNSVAAHQVVYTPQQNMISTQYTQNTQGIDNCIANQTYPMQSNVNTPSPEKMQTTEHLSHPQNIESPPSYNESWQR